MARLIFWVIVLGGLGSLVYFAFQKDGSRGAGVPGGIKPGAFAEGKLQENYLKHGYKFSDISQEQFWIDARTLLESPVSDKALSRTTSEGDIERFKPSTGEYARMDKNGVIQEYMRADEKFWNNPRISP